MAYYVPPSEKVGVHVPRVPHQIAPMVVTELTTIIYATLMLKERLCDNNGYFAVKRTLKLNNFLKRETFGQQDD